MTKEATSESTKHRVEFETGSRNVKLVVDGTIVADTAQPLLVSETALPLRYYFPESAVKKQFLESVSTNTHCPYKGDANYYDIVVNGERYENTAWYYPDPIPGTERLKGTIAFWSEKDERIQLIVGGA